MLQIISRLIDSNSSQLKKTDKPLEKIKELRKTVTKLSFDDMRKRIDEMRSELANLSMKIPESDKLSIKKIDRIKSLPEKEREIQSKLYEFMPEVYAFVDEIFFRKVGFRYHDVQLRAAIILAQGQRLVELFTGEGKTMTFQLPTILYSLVGRGAHLVTVNDYLSRRDGEYAGHIASELGLTVGIINSDVSYKFVPDHEIEKYFSEERLRSREELKSIEVSKMSGVNLMQVTKKEAYSCDITYGTNNEFGFDYLRDNMAWDLENLCQRELYYCLIDEADSILIDEARTPLIISGIPSDAEEEKYIKFAKAASVLQENEDYKVDHKGGGRAVVLTEEGIKKVEAILGIDNLWRDYSSAYHMEKALQAKALFHRDEHYIVKNGEVLIVDEFTGRILHGRRYSEGLHQAIEAKEGVKIQPESRTYATITFQNYFRLYKILCGGSGTIMTEGEEFYKIYGLESISIPTNKPVIRIDYPDRIYKNQESKFKAVIDEIKEKHSVGQPVLVGTTSVEKSEIISKLLDKEGIPHEVLNAKYHEQEAKIIERAGVKGAVTVATNMAGRGADIVIGGGKRGDEAWKEVAQLGGLHVIGTERHEARRIDNQLRGRTGRQGEPGSSRFYVALDDTIMKILGGEIIARLMSFVRISDDTPIENRLISKQIEIAQKKIENLNFDARKRIVEYDDVMNQHREIFYARRKNFLLRFELAEEKVMEENKVMVLSMPQYTDKRKEYEPKIQESKRQIKNAIRNIFYEVFDHKLKNKELERGDEKIKRSIQNFLNLVPEELMCRILNLSKTSLELELINKFKSFKNKEDRNEFWDEILDSCINFKFEEFGDDLYRLTKILLLQSMDNMWVEHLETMKDIKEGVILQQYAQKDPLIEYKNKAYVVFQEFLQKVN
ncbi:preprotein translocase subunit SecA, partial [Candidatus Dojkabacteria bacterium]